MFFVRYLRPMTQQEFAAATDALPLTGRQLAAWLGTGDKALSSYRTGRRSVPGPVACAVQCARIMLDAGITPPDWPAP